MTASLLTAREEATSRSDAVRHIVATSRAVPERAFWDTIASAPKAQIGSAVRHFEYSGIAGSRAGVISLATI